ncbi:MAG TPA: tRNA 2-thiouridine(34) synthase MnmA [Candidatus Eubacterium faecavium]|nr:tRNA 2-thiouridine(34) synthase MnmA [Candidatus Eubacterium faecavium]
MGKKALIAMSGGVDSSVAALLMKKAGYDCIGAMMRLWGGANEQDEKDAAAVAERLGIPFYVFDCSDEFQNRVINKFIDTYEKGATPNPCLDCNRYMKFGALYRKARELGCNYIATGHYAVTELDKTTGRYLLKKAADSAKDQSYVLYSLSQEILRHVILPLGRHTKSEIRTIAQENGFVNSHKKESQDICFVPDGDYASFIERERGKTYPPGEFVTTDGEIVGRHSGIIRYTIGQRKGLGVSYRVPLYVCAKDMEHNRVILTEGRDLFSKEVTAADINLISVDRIEDGMRVSARTRYNMKEQPATAYQTDDNTIKVVFDEPQRAAAPGQALVLYSGKSVVGGGTII